MHVALLCRFLAFATLFCVGLVGFPAVSILAHGVLPSLFGNWFFFWPQIALAFYGFTAPADDMSRTFLSDGGSIAIAVAFWSLVGLALAWLFRYKRMTVLNWGNAYEADFNQDGRSDYLVEMWGGGNGIASGHADRVFALSSGDSFKVATVRWCSYIANSYLVKAAETVKLTITEVATCLRSMGQTFD
jgi:hypothetical protein